MARLNGTAHYSLLIQWSNEDQAFLVTLPEWADRVLGPVTHGEPLPQPRTVAGV